MGWSHEVHDNRVTESLKRERLHFHHKRKGLVLQEGPDAKTVPFTVMLGAATSFLLWNKYNRRLSSIEWKQLPVLKQFYALVTGDTSSLSAAPKAGGVRPKQRPVPAAKSVKPATTGKVRWQTEPPFLGDAHRLSQLLPIRYAHVH